MKALPLIAASVAGLFLVSCDEVTVVTYEYESDSNGTTETDGSPAEKRAQGDRDPIPAVTPPGSQMDPSSNVYIILDGSGSMQGNPILEAKRAVTSFVEGAPEDLNIGLFCFDYRNMKGTELVALGKGEEQRQALKQAISRVSAGGRTPLGNAIMHGTDALIERFQMQLRYGDIRLIVVTDGAATDDQVFDQSIRHARKHHVPIYTIGFHMRSSHPLRQHSESYLTASDERELLKAMEETLAELDDDAEL